MRFRTHPNPRRCLAHIKTSAALAAHMHYLSHIWSLDTEQTHTGIQENPSDI